MPLTIDIVSDVICPWCFIGKRRLKKALAIYDAPATVQWHPFQLNPSMPPEGVSRREYRTRKFGSWERSQKLDARVIAVGKEEGIDFAFDRIERTPNTRDAHRLVWLSGNEGVQDAVVEGLFRAYFVEARDISDRRTLIDVVAEAGLDRSKAESLLTGEEGTEALKQAESLSRQHRVDGVPFFIINGQVALAGTPQYPQTFLDAFKRAGD